MKVVTNLFFVVTFLMLVTDKPTFGIDISYFHNFTKEMEKLKGDCLKTDCGEYLKNNTICSDLLNGSSTTSLAESLSKVFKFFGLCNKKRATICGRCFRNVTLNSPSGNVYDKEGNITYQSKEHISNFANISVIKGTTNVKDKENKKVVSFGVLFPRVTLTTKVQYPDINGKPANVTAYVHMLDLELHGYINFAISNGTINCGDYYAPYKCPFTKVIVILKSAAKLKNPEELKKYLVKKVNAKHIRPLIRKKLSVVIRQILCAFVSACKR